MANIGQITEQEVRHVAKLGRLRLSDEEIQHFAGQLSRVLDYMGKLNELDVADVAPMAHAADMINVLRDDEPAPPMSVDKALQNAPEKWPPFFKVPKVLGDVEGG